MQRYQWSQLVFVIISIFQSYLFIYYPSLLEPLSGNAVDSPPYYPMLRLLGCKELGLLGIYMVGIVLNDLNIAWLTVYGRASTLIVMPYVVITTRTDLSALGGVVQDSLGFIATAYFLSNDPIRRINKMLPIKVEKHTRLPRLAIFAAGVFETAYGLQLFFYPLSRRISPVPPKNPLGMSLFGYMTALVGLYQLGISIACTQDALVYFAVSAHHFIFYFTVQKIASVAAGANFSPPVEHLYLGIAILVATTACVSQSVRTRSQERRKIS